MKDVFMLYRDWKKEKDRKKISDDQDELDLDITEATVNIDKKVIPKKRKAFIILGIVIGALFIGYYSYIAQQNKIIRTNKARVTQLQSEPHTSLKFYMNEGTEDERLNSASMLIAHTLDTGCSESYRLLQEIFPASSLSYLQDYLLGKSCTSYESPLVVNVLLNNNYGEYIIRVGKKQTKLLLTIYHKNYVVSEFKIEPYIERDLIK